MTGHSGTVGQLDLFGGSAPAVPAPRSPRPSDGANKDSNDLDLIRHIAGNATRGLYLLVGTSERVYARAEAPDSPTVVRVPRYEEDAVHQLLRRAWLTLGGTHRVACGAASLTGTAVLAPKVTRTRVARWEHLARPASWRTEHDRARR
jgi:hypothetical protein